MNLNPASFISLKSCFIGLRLQPRTIFLFNPLLIILWQKSFNHSLIGIVPASSNASLCPILTQSSISAITWSVVRIPLCSPSIIRLESTQKTQPLAPAHQQRFEDKKWVPLEYL